MLTTKTQNYFTKFVDVRSLAFILSLFLSLLWYCYHQPINVDGMLYLQATEIFKNEGLKACMAVYSWPFYSILIALVSKTTGLSILNAAYLLTSFLIGLIVVSFITVVKDLGADKLTQYIACFSILMFPTLAHERYDIFRDFGYYAFALLSVHYLLRYQQHRLLKFALAWGITSFIATLFRIEGLVFQLCMPMVLFFSKFIDSKWQRCLLVLKAHTINICLLLIAFIFLILTHHHDWGRLNNISLANLIKLTESFNDYLLIIKSNFNVFIAQDAKIILIGGMIALVIKNIFVTLTPVNAFLSCYGVNLVPWQKDQKLVIYSYLFLNICILAGFVWVEFFLVIRYVIFLALLILLFVPFTVREVIARFQRNKTWISEKIRITCVMLSLLFLALNSLFILGANKTYIIDAGNWIKANTQPKDRLFTTEIKLLYYSNRPGTRYPDDFPYGIGVNLFTIQNVNFKNYEYAAIGVAKDHIAYAKNLFDELHLKVVKDFMNNRGDVIYILKCEPSNTTSTS